MSRRLLLALAARRRRATRPSFIAARRSPAASRRVQADELEARPAPPLRLTANDSSGAPATRGARWRTTDAPHESPAISSSSRAGGDTA